MNTVVAASALTKKYKDVVAVDKLDLEIYDGELFALLGVNGAGKTTTIKMLTGLTKPTSGEAAVDGLLLRDVDKIKEIVDISMQETAIARNLTVKENIELQCALHGQSKEETAETVRRLYDVFSLQAAEKRRAGKLSGGWQRKLSIALALASKPKILFLDEPTLGLDVTARRELWKTILSLKKQMTVVLTTHYMEEAEKLCDRLGIMKDGKLLFCGTKEQLFAETGTDNVEDAFLFLVEGGKNDDEIV